MVVFVRTVTHRADDRTLQSQYDAITPLSELLGTKGQVYVHGSVEILVLLNRPNLNPYVFLDWGADDFAASLRSTSFAAIIDEMEAQAPKLVSISRLRKVNHRMDLERWVDQHYDNLDQYANGKVRIRREP